MAVRGRRLSGEEARIWSRTGQLPEWAKTQNLAPYKPRKRPTIFVGVDGEGQTDPLTGRHTYTLLGAADEHGQTWYVENPRGLSTDECLRFLVSFSAHHKLFAYSFGYDLTKILEDIDARNLYQLFRPETRRKVLPNGGTVSKPVHWPDEQPRWSLNYLNGRFSVKEVKSGVEVDEPTVTTTETVYGFNVDALYRMLFGRPRLKYGKGVTVHDIWKFFGSKFTNALEDWKVPSDIPENTRRDVLTRMREMKDKRSKFDQISRDEILRYCLDECRYMAELARKLTVAHDQAGIPLKSYFGAGSSAAAMLDKMGIRVHVTESRKETLDPHLVHAMGCAFFGGRFENSVLGAVEGPVWSYDISSAYPYHITFLPCLLHGRWERTRDRAVWEKARAAVIHYRLRRPARIPAPLWAPFPFRFGKGREGGSICFPESGQRGWVWRDEYLAGERLFPNVQPLEAWAYHCECDCQPFADIPGFYKQRLAIGKEGPGIVIKLGTNSCYGKTAQCIGGEVGKYTSWMWAGMITSGCRAQALDAMGCHRDLDNLLMIATDGIATRERLSLPVPRDTGTAWTPCPTPSAKDQKNRDVYRQRDDGQWLVNKPLGGWEEKEIPKGMFLARPGIYFPLNPTDSEIEKVRARGLGRSTVYEGWREIVAAYERGDSSVMLGQRVKDADGNVKELTRFVGAKTGVYRIGKPGAYQYKRSRDFGRWIVRPVAMSFSPLPKREKVLSNGRLSLRRVEGESAMYSKTMISDEARDLIFLQDEAWEQPSGGDLSYRWE